MRLGVMGRAGGMQGGGGGGHRGGGCMLGYAGRWGSYTPALVWLTVDGGPEIGC